ncbi:MAG: hypothetical protein AB7S78_14230 [Candidatus Omnitrophota bacterium]
MPAEQKTDDVSLRTIEITIQTRIFPDGPGTTQTFSRALGPAENLPGLLDPAIKSSLTDLFYLTDQPENCPRCGSRTEFEETVCGNDRLDNPIVEQYHKCLNPDCRYEYDAAFLKEKAV